MLQNKLMLLVLPSSFKLVGQTTNQIVIRCQFFLPANNYNRLQLMVYSCLMSSNCVWLHIIFCSCVKETTHEDIHLKRYLVIKWKKKQRIEKAKSNYSENEIRKHVWVCCHCIGNSGFFKGYVPFSQTFFRFRTIKIVWIFVLTATKIWNKIDPYSSCLLLWSSSQFHWVVFYFFTLNQASSCREMEVEK